mgnify:CR=1 FL=1
MEAEINRPVTDLLKDTYYSIFGSEPVVRGVTHGSDMHIFTNAAHIPTVLFGPGSLHKAHMVDEYIEASEVVKAAKVIALSVMRWCGR